MPKETFFNLPEEKRTKIEEAAIKEFMEYNFDASSVNRIVKYSKIPKGSFYQYFEDKRDLYKHIMSLVIQAKLKYLTPVMMNPFEHSFFTMMREMYESGLNFARENEPYVAIGSRLLSDPSHPLFKEIVEDNMEVSNGVFKTLLEKGIERGEIRAGIDLDLTAFLMTSLNSQIVEYYQKYINNFKDMTHDDKVLITVDKFLDFLQFGIGQPKEAK